MATLAAIDHQALGDLELAVRTRGGDGVAARVLTTRYNQRLFRTAFAILRDRAEAEEASTWGRESRARSC
jgi:RNA polymerase sigma-70 factor (ECF subfamily)